MPRSRSRSNTNSFIDTTTLQRDLSHYLKSSISTNTRATYRSGYLSFKIFCEATSVPTFPLTESTLQLFVTYLARRVKFATIKVYLCGVQYESVIRGFNTKIAHMGRLYYVLRGIRRCHPNSASQRLPITPADLRKMIMFIKNSMFSNHDKAMWTCLILVAFFGLLRVSEYVCPAMSTFDTETHLTPADISFSTCGSNAVINLKCSKTDPFRLGCKIRLAKIGGFLCPYRAIQNYLVFRGTKLGPWFTFSDGKFVTRKFVSSFLTISLPNNININTHSFRIGGASAAASCGIPDSTIKIIGRWSSDCYRRYIHLSDNALTEWSTRIAELNGLTKIWDIKSVL